MTDASVPLDGDARATDTTRRTVTPLWLAVTIAVLFGVLYAYDVWEAVRDLVGMSLMIGDLGVSFAGWGLALLIAALVMPILVYVLAFWLGYRRGPLAQVMLFLTGYALVQVLTADIGAFFELGGIDFG